ncbi:MAG: iron donor protein CyaY [Telluria sp.]
MSETEFLDLVDQTLDTIEAAMDRLNDEDVVDVECKRSGNVLEIEFIDNGSKIIVNSQAPLQEMWVAARSGGYHYKRVDGQWRNTRDDTEFYASLSRMASEQGGAVISIAG